MHALIILVGERDVLVEGPGENRGLATKGIPRRPHPFRGRTGRKEARFLATKGMKHRRRAFRGASKGTDMRYSGQTGRTEIPL